MWGNCVFVKECKEKNKICISIRFSYAAKFCKNK